MLPPLDSPERAVTELTGMVRPASAVTISGRQGLYAWWCRTDHLADFSPSVPAVHPDGCSDGWSLLYVGIGPVKEGSRTLTDRLVKDHRSGNIGGSTLRQSLAALLRDHLNLQPQHGSDRSRLVTETPLTRWMTSNLGLTVSTRPRPWEIEHAVITGMNPPLNIQGGTHPFRHEVSAARKALRDACGL